MAYCELEAGPAKSGPWILWNVAGALETPNGTKFVKVQPLVSLNGQVPLAWWSLSNLLKLDDVAHIYFK